MMAMPLIRRGTTAITHVSDWFISVRDESVNVIKVKNVWGTISTIELDTVRSYMANPMGLESSQWDWIHVDEPNAREVVWSQGSIFPATNQISWIKHYRKLIVTERDGGFYYRRHQVVFF